MKRIPFKPELAKAIREGRKTQTRRLLNPQPPLNGGFASNPFNWSSVEQVGDWFHIYAENPNGMFTVTAKYKVGEVVGILEPWFTYKFHDNLSGKEIAETNMPTRIHFLSDGPKPEELGRFRQARFLPDAFVRTKIRILEVRVERLDDISEDDAKAEGVEKEYVDDEVLTAEDYASGYTTPMSYGCAFARLWDRIHGKDTPWQSNPWVWVFKFEVL